MVQTEFFVVAVENEDGMIVNPCVGIICNPDTNNKLIVFIFLNSFVVTLDLCMVRSCSYRVRVLNKYPMNWVNYRFIYKDIYVNRFNDWYKIMFVFASVAIDEMLGSVIQRWVGCELVSYELVRSLLAVGTI